MTMVDIHADMTLISVTHEVGEKSKSRILLFFILLAITCYIFKTIVRIVRVSRKHGVTQSPNFGEILSVLGKPL